VPAPAEPVAVSLVHVHRHKETGASVNKWAATSHRSDDAEHLHSLTTPTERMVMLTEPGGDAEKERVTP